MRGATISYDNSLSSKVFQSTRPMRGATIGSCKRIPTKDVSIHAPHAGRDLS